VTEVVGATLPFGQPDDPVANIYLSKGWRWKVHENVSFMLWSYQHNTGHGNRAVNLNPMLLFQVQTLLRFETIQLNDCLYRNLYKYRHIAVFDVDEV
jgi:hypothetical protein